MIVRHDGVPVLADPGWTASRPILGRLPQLVEHGLAGIEVYYPDHTPEMVTAFRQLADRYGLVVTGGTDYRGGGVATRVPLRRVPVPPAVMPALRARGMSMRARR